MNTSAIASTDVLAGLAGLSRGEKKGHARAAESDTVELQDQDGDHAPAVESFLAGSPEALRAFHASIQLLRQVNPALAQAFARSIRGALEQEAPAELSIAVEVRTASATVQVNGDGFELSASAQAISIRATFSVTGSSSESPEPVEVNLEPHSVHTSGLDIGNIFDVDGDGDFDLDDLLALFSSATPEAPSTDGDVFELTASSGFEAAALSLDYSDSFQHLELNASQATAYSYLNARLAA